MVEAVTIAVCVVALVSFATWLASLRNVSRRMTFAAVVKHSKPNGLEIVHMSRSIGACNRYVKQHKRLGESMVVMSREDVDAENLACISHPQFWRDISNLTKGTPAEVAGLARSAEVLADRLATVVHRIGDVSQTEPLTKVDGIPLGHREY